MARGCSAGDHQLMQSTADARQRPVVLDTGELRPAVERRGRVARAVLDVVVAVLLGAGAIAAGGWSIMTAVRGDPGAGQPAPLWYPTPEQVQGAGSPPAPAPSPRGLRAAATGTAAAARPASRGYAARATR